MFRNLYASSNEKMDYPSLDSSLSFADYISQCQAMLKKQRSPHFHKDLICKDLDFIVNANSPFECKPESASQTKKYKYGALLIHGLLDSPFSYRDLSKILQSEDIFSRAILLPGHGGVPEDLTHTSYHDWIQVVRYGIESMKNEVEHLFLIGYSTGAALSLYHALQSRHIEGLILLSPAIRIKAPVDMVVNWHYFLRRIRRNHNQWVFQEDECDYAKYKSIPLHAVRQVSKLTDELFDLCQHKSVQQPMLMIVSEEDETISSHHALNFFSSMRHPESKLLLYTSQEKPYADKRILARQSVYPDLNIKHFSHIAIPFAPNNPHYGQYGDYLEAAHIETHHVIYGAYNRIEENLYNAAYELGLIENRRKALTYNPDFDYMSKKIVNFIKRNAKSI